jgi:transcriptional regulator with XRE-family HTH domain
MLIRLREWRERRGESLYSLAAKADIHFTTIVRIEKGTLSPTVSTLENLAKALSISVRDFFPLEKKRQYKRRGT